MGWVWNPIGMFGIAAGLLAWGLAYFVLRARPDRWQNRFLALFFALEGAYALWGQGIRLMLAGDDMARVVLAAGYTLLFFGAPLVWWAYFAFLSTVDSPVSRVLRRPWIQGVVGLAMLSVALHTLVDRSAYVTGLLPWRHLDAWQYDVGWAAQYILFWIPPVMDLVGIVVAVTGLRAARTAAARRQFKFYTVAFATFDVLNIAWYTLLNLEINDHDSPAWVEQAYFALGPLALISLTLLLGYAVMQTHLFDIDLKIKAGVRRGLIAAPFAVAFFVLAETMEGVLPFPGYWAGLAGAGLVALALQPIRWLARRAADRLFPGVRDTADYRATKKEQVYQAALEGALRDGVVTDRERDILSGLRNSLGLSHAAASRLERQLAG